jgi:ribosomal protein S18 acetylase RimI-like enzyme
MSDNQVKMRPGTKADLPFFREMLFEAMYWRPDQKRPPLDVGLQRPDAVYLLDGWGRTGDTAVIAATETGEKVGASWYRFWDDETHSYGYVSPDIPEVGIGVKPDCRGQGIGHQLIGVLLETATAQGLKKVSLSVEMDNYAQKLYRRHGFEPIEQVENSWTMVVDLNR